MGKKGTALISSFAYTYNSGTGDLAQRQSVTTPSGTTYFHYDSFGRLCYYASTSSSNACSSPPSGATSFTYDADGNRLSMVSGGTTTSYAYNAADELCARSTSGTASCSSPNYSWDADGNMLSSPTITSLVYNAKNQTVSRTYGGSSQSLSYADADQTERVTEGNVTEAWSPLGMSEETNAYGATYYLRDNQGNPIGEYHAANYYFLTDGQGSVVDVIEGANGETSKAYEYDPFGNVTEIYSGTGSDVRYDGNGYWDKASSNPGSPPLYHIGTRYYDPTTSRWTQQDPIGGTVEGSSAGNSYVYTGDDPVDNIDPSGMLTVCGSSVWALFKPWECHAGRVLAQPFSDLGKAAWNVLGGRGSLSQVGDLAGGAGSCAAGAGFGALVGGPFAEVTAPLGCIGAVEGAYWGVPDTVWKPNG